MSDIPVETRRGIRSTRKRLFRGVEREDLYDPWVFPDGFIGLAIAGVLLEILVVLRAKRSYPQRDEQRVPATVAHLQGEKSTGKTRWYITATWSDLQTHQTHTFQSGPLTHLPPWRVGETVIVAFNPRNPQQFRIE